MNWLAKLADRLILFPTVEPIEVEDKQRVTVRVPQGNAEIWTSKTRSGVADPVKIAVLKFTGNAGRAEYVSCHPFDLLPQVEADVWAVNHCGYGGSDGAATMATIATTCDAAYEALKNAFPDRPMLVCGNSLGCLSALYLAARQSVSGVYLRNGPPLRQMISGQWVYNWWNLGFARMVARQVPDELDCIANAARSNAPAVFLQSENDTVVPVKYQNMIYHEYAGDKRKFTICGADHHDGIADENIGHFAEQIDWLIQEVQSHD